MAGPIATFVVPEDVGPRIVVIRGKKVIVDSALAELYGVSTGRLNEQVRRNTARFPLDFCFRLSNQELTGLISQFATSNGMRRGRGGRRKLPIAFTEHGAIMAASVLNTPRAIQASVFVVRAFVRLRATLATHREFAKKLTELERKTEALSLKHDALAIEARAQFRQLVEALRQLMAAPRPKSRPIGFVLPQEKSS